MREMNTLAERNVPAVYKVSRIKRWVQKKAMEQFI